MNKPVVSTQLRKDCDKSRKNVENADPLKLIIEENSQSQEHGIKSSKSLNTIVSEHIIWITLILWVICICTTLTLLRTLLWKFPVKSTLTN